MLFNSFIHIPGIGEKTEKMLWESGIHSWDDFRSQQPPSGLSRQKLRLIEQHLEAAREQDLPPHYFAKSLSASQVWRIFPHCRQSTAYIDIETDGLWGDQSTITTIALYDGTRIFHYVQGENLERFPEDIGRYQLLVTYNGKCFDLPVIERFFGIHLGQAHIDLRYVLHNLGISGGLKGCEKQLGLNRGELDGVDGYFAVLLWREYQKSGDRRFLETLLAYNIEDSVNLETLMVHAYNRNVARTPFAERLAMELPLPPARPFAADLDVVRRLQDAMVREF